MEFDIEALQGLNHRNTHVPYLFFRKFTVNGVDGTYTKDLYVDHHPKVGFGVDEEETLEIVSASKCIWNSSNSKADKTAAKHAEFPSDRLDSQLGCSRGR